MKYMPCPICETYNPDIEDTWDYYPKWLYSEMKVYYWVKCTNCKHVGPQDRTKRRAARKWNHEYRILKWREKIR